MKIRKNVHKIDKKQVMDAFVEMAKIKKIETDLLQGIIEDTLSLMVKRKYGNDSNFEIVVNMQKGDLEIYLIKKVVDNIENPEVEISLEEANMYSTEPLNIGDDFIEEITLENIADSFGRRLVAYASQAMNQKIHDLERNNIYLEYKSKEGEMIVGEIFQKRPNMMVIVHNGIEMKLLREDQLPSDVVLYRKNKVIKTIIKSVINNHSGPAPEIILSRKCDNFVMRLFELEVPEVNDGIVQIRAIARDPGERMKIALSSGIDRIDPVGACVGLKGIRINSIISELGNEQIDLIHWSDDPSIMIEKAIMPAKIKAIELAPETKSATVIVSEEQISMAIGRNGQNIRLASQLTGYAINLLKEGGEDIDIKEFAEEIGNENLEKLLENNIETARDFLEATPEILLNNCNMNYESIIEVRRVILLEFDENEFGDYIEQLKQIAEIKTKESIVDIEVTEEVVDNVIDENVEGIEIDEEDADEEDDEDADEEDDEDDADEEDADEEDTDEEDTDEEDDEEDADEEDDEEDILF